MNENTQFQFPDEAGYFDQRTVVQIFATFDTPTIYTFISRTNDLFFAYQYDEETDLQANGASTSTWLFIPTDQAKIKRLVQGEITLREFFRLALFGYLLTMRGGVIIGSSETLKYTDFPVEYLPAEGVKLKRNTSEIVVTVEKPGLNPFSAPDQLLTDLLTDFRKAVRKIMRGLKELGEDFDTCKTTPKYALTGINWGSLGLTLTPIETNELFAASLDTIQKVVANPETKEVSDEIRSLVKSTLYTIAPKARGKYNFDRIRFSGSLMSGPEMSKDITFALSSIETELYKAEATMNQPTTIKLTGVVRAIDLDDDFFRLSSVETNDFDIHEIKCNYEQDVFEGFTSDEKPASILEKRVTVECEYIPKVRSVDVISITQA